MSEELRQDATTQVAEVLRAANGPDMEVFALFLRNPSGEEVATGLMALPAVTRP